MPGRFEKVAVAINKTFQNRVGTNFDTRVSSGMFGELPWSCRVKTTEVKKFECVAIDFDAVVLCGESPFVKIPISDIKPRIAQNDAREKRWNKVDPSLVGEQCIGKINNSFRLEALMPPMEKLFPRL